MATHSSTLAGESHGWRSLVGCSPWGCKELDTTERLPFHFSLPALEKAMATHSSVLTWTIPGTGGAWWAAISGVAQSWTQLKRLSSSSNGGRDRARPAALGPRRTGMWVWLVLTVGWGGRSVQFSSVTQLCPILCDPMNRSTPGLPVHHHLPEFTYTHIH